MRTIHLPKLLCLFAVIGYFSVNTAQSQLHLPNDGVNYACKAGRKIGLTDIDIRWNAPGVKGREGKIWGTPVAYYGFSVLGYGSNIPSPWRAGANESTVFSFTTDVTINGKTLAAGSYGFYIALYPDSCTLIFNKNTAGWGSYFYNSNLDVLRVSTVQQKDIKESKERLDFTFSKQTAKSVEVALEWEHWRIPFTVEVDLVKTTLASIKAQMSSELGFDPPSLQSAADWCLRNNVNEEEALNWINSAIDPNLGGVKSFNALSTKAGLLNKMNRKAEAEQVMATALENASVIEMHGYGRRLLSEKKNKEALEVFEKNAKKNKGAWPTNAGLMRGYSANGDLKKALEHAKLALAQAPDEQNRKALEEMVKTLSEGKPL